MKTLKVVASELAELWPFWVFIIVVIIIILLLLFRSITMQNLEIVTSKLAELWPFIKIQSNCVYYMVVVVYGHAFHSKIGYALLMRTITSKTT